MFNMGAIKAFCRRLGVEVSRTENTIFEQRKSVLRRLGVDLVVDVGANIGQYAGELRRQGYAGRILSVEPLRDAFGQLVVAAGTDSNWECINCAVGRENGLVDIHRAANSVSSSVMRVTGESTSSCADSAEIGVEQTSLRTLDSLLREYARGAKNPYLKMDTQGFEMEVLLGARESLKNVVGLEVELSFVELYRGQPLFFEVAKQLYSEGFILVWIERGFQRADHSLLQADGLFIRRPADEGRLSS